MPDEPRLYKIRVFADGLPFEGVGVVIKCPTHAWAGEAEDGVRAVSRFLVEQVAAGRIRRFQLGLANVPRLAYRDPDWRSRLIRFPEAWAQIERHLVAA
jgi:hypothetical protein